MPSKTIPAKDKATAKPAIKAARPIPEPVKPKVIADPALLAEAERMMRPGQRIVVESPNSVLIANA